MAWPSIILLSVTNGKSGRNYLIKVAIEIGISSGSGHNKTQIKVMRRLSGLCKYLGTFHIIAGA